MCYHACVSVRGYVGLNSIFELYVRNNLLEISLKFKFKVL